MPDRLLNRRQAVALLAAPVVWTAAAAQATPVQTDGPFHPESA